MRLLNALRLRLLAWRRARGWGRPLPGWGRLALRILDRIALTLS